jgi:hypothetical protein
MQMKNYLKPVLAIYLAIAFTEMHAQIKPGYIFGMNLSTLSFKNEGKISDPSTLIGVHYGGFYEIPLNRNFALQPSLLFSAKGSNYKIDTLAFSISPIYIEGSLIVSYSFGSNAIKISLFAGPYFAIGIGGYKIESGGELKNISFGSGENNDLKPFDAGFNLGAGVNIKGFVITAQYGIGLANLSPATTIDSEMKNKVIGISISSLFTGRE